MKNQLVTRTSIIRCPNCGAEYLPGEIYLPGSLIGQPEDLVKDSFGKLLYEDYKSEPAFEEHFTCEYCNKPFIIEATVTFKTKNELPERDFSSEYVSLLD